jgi:hypothetical protein
VIHLSDTAAAFIGVIVGPTLVLAGALMSDTTWDRWYGSGGREGRLYSPVLSRVPRSVGRAFFIAVGIVATFGGVVLFALGRA